MDYTVLIPGSGSTQPWVVYKKNTLSTSINISYTSDVSHGIYIFSYRPFQKFMPCHHTYISYPPNIYSCIIIGDGEQVFNSSSLHFFNQNLLCNNTYIPLYPPVCLFLVLYISSYMNIQNIPLLLSHTIHIYSYHQQTYTYIHVWILVFDVTILHLHKFFFHFTFTFTFSHNIFFFRSLWNSCYLRMCITTYMLYTYYIYKKGIPLRLYNAHPPPLLLPMGYMKFENHPT